MKGIWKLSPMRKSVSPEYQVTVFSVYNPILIDVYAWKKREREREFLSYIQKHSPLTSLKTTDHVSAMTH